MLIKFIFFIFQICFIISIIKIPFELEKTEEKEYDFERDTFYNNYSSIIELGNPIQKIKTKISMEESSFYILKDKLYNPSKSNTYKIINEEENDIKNEDYSSGIFSSELFILKDLKDKKIKIENLNFMLATKKIFDKELQSMLIGFKNMDYFKEKKRNLIFQLKNLSIINSYTFTIKYNKNNNDKGEIIIGNNPDEYDKDYLSSNFRYGKVETDNYQRYWQFTFDKIISENITIDTDVLMRFSFDFGVIVSNNYYNNYIKSKFFTDNIKNKTCDFKFLSNHNFYFYSCNENVYLKNFPKLTLYNKILNYTFEFDYNDLFIKVNDRYYFLVVFQLQQGFQKWILGKPFMKKYQMVFDQDKDIIGFYTFIYKKSSFGFFHILSLIFLIIIIILCVLYFKLLFNKKRRIRACELDENIDYVPYDI